MKLFFSPLPLLFTICSYAQASNDTLKPQDMIEPCEQAHFPGGNGELNKFMNKILIYPDQDSGIQGKVYVSFSIDTAGKISDANVKRGINPDFDKEALRLFNLMPDWIPMKCNGVPQKTRMILPVIFKIQ
jgi:periplasmic protein TonB